MELIETIKVDRDIRKFQITIIDGELYEIEKCNDYFIIYYPDGEEYWHPRNRNDFLDLLRNRYAIFRLVGYRGIFDIIIFDIIKKETLHRIEKCNGIGRYWDENNFYFANLKERHFKIFSFCDETMKTIDRGAIENHYVKEYNGEYYFFGRYPGEGLVDSEVLRPCQFWGSKIAVKTQGGYEIFDFIEMKSIKSFRDSSKFIMFQDFIIELNYKKIDFYDLEYNFLFSYEMNTCGWTPLDIDDNYIFIYNRSTREYEKYINPLGMVPSK